MNRIEPLELIYSMNTDFSLDPDNKDNCGEMLCPPHCTLCKENSAEDIFAVNNHFQINSYNSYYANKCVKCSAKSKV
jgi:hypothetical protein